jgi:hypothetical protein
MQLEQAVAPTTADAVRQGDIAIQPSQLDPQNAKRV